MGPPGVRPSNRLTQSKYSSEPPQRNWASRLIFSTRIPRAWASFSMSATVPCSPGRTTWNSSSRKTGTRAAAMSSSIWGPATAIRGLGPAIHRGLADAMCLVQDQHIEAVGLSRHERVEVLEHLLHLGRPGAQGEE